MTARSPLERLRQIAAMPLGDRDLTEVTQLLRVALSPLGRGYWDAIHGNDTCPYSPDDLDCRESEAHGCIITSAERWRQGHQDAGR